VASTLNSASTWAEIDAAYRDNASYFEDNSPTKAAAFITACRFKLLMPQRIKQGGSGSGQEMENSPDAIQEQLKAAQAWYGANVTTGGVGQGYVRTFSIEDFR
jgi:hypothetical protein